MARSVDGRDKYKCKYSWYLHRNHKQGFQAIPSFSCITCCFPLAIGVCVCVCSCLVCKCSCLVFIRLVCKCPCSVSWSPCALAVTIWKGIPCSTFQCVGDIHGRGWQCKTTIVLLSKRLLRNYVCLPTCQVHWCSCARTSCHFPIALSLTLSVASVRLTSHNFPSQCVCVSGSLG